MAMKFVLLASSLMAAVAFAQQRPVPPAFSRSGGARGATPLELDPQQPVPQPFRRVSLPLYRGRGFSLQDGQEPKPIQISQLPPFQPRQPSPVDNNNNELNRAGNVGGGGGGSDDDDNADGQPQQTGRPQLQQQAERIQQQQADRNGQQERIQQQQADRNGQLERTQQQQQFQQIDRIQQQPEKQFPSFRPQPQIKPVETQPQFVRKVVQRPLKRTQVIAVEDTVATSRSPETVQRMKLERSESADKQRAKKPVSQVLRRYRDDNPDGSITWGFENDDGTFKEETIGVDCVTRGKYGYIDPEGVKREYSYQSGVPCDRNRVQVSADPSQGQSSAVQEAQASDSYGYIDYTKNQYVMANGKTIDLNNMAKNRARKPVSRNKPAVAPQPQPQPQPQFAGRSERRFN